jgi:peptide chain release factor subunit 1
MKKSQGCEVRDKALLLDWLVENYKNYGVKLQLISDKTQEGSQFCKGFGGIGGKNMIFFN